METVKHPAFIIILLYTKYYFSLTINIGFELCVHEVMDS